MAKRISVVVSQGQSANPAKRELEENIVSALLFEPGIEVMVVPHLYDLKKESTGILALQGISGPIILISWLYERAARWTLDRNNVRGQAGVTLIVPPEDDDEDDALEGEDAADKEVLSEKERVADARPPVNRKIYCLDLRLLSSPEPYVNEVRRIRDELNTQVVELTSWLGGSPSTSQMDRFLTPTNDTALGETPTEIRPAGVSNDAAQAVGQLEVSSPSVLRFNDEADRRWYPVIDYSRCTNCMECIDFCLFGVYGVDKVETILVEQPDNCRKGCPACSRVCPENAIIFPQHKTPAIAGANVSDGGGLKIDLSRLFGAPEKPEDVMAIAARERDEQLMLAGRDAVGMTVGIPKRQAKKENAPKDDLDSLIDSLDELDI